MSYTTCNLTSKPCRHCSLETYLQVGIKFKRHPITKLSIPAGSYRNNLILGQICNNAPLKTNPWIDTMKICPVIDSLEHPPIYIPYKIKKYTRKKVAS